MALMVGLQLLIRTDFVGISETHQADAIAF